LSSAGVLGFGVGLLIFGLIPFITFTVIPFLRSRKRKKYISIDQFKKNMKQAIKQGADKNL